MSAFGCKADMIGERNRKITANRGPDAGEVFRAVIHVIGDDESAAAQALLKQRKILTASSPPSIASPCRV
jgi:hypothetical protein